MARKSLDARLYAERHSYIDLILSEFREVPMAYIVSLATPPCLGGKLTRVMRMIDWLDMIYQLDDV